MTCWSSLRCVSLISFLCVLFLFTQRLRVWSNTGQIYRFLREDVFRLALGPLKSLLFCKLATNRDDSQPRRLISVSVTSVICPLRQSALSFDRHWKRVHRDLRAAIVCALQCLITSDWGTVLKKKKTSREGEKEAPGSWTCPTMDRWDPPPPPNTHTHPMLPMSEKRETSSKKGAPPGRSPLKNTECVRAPLFFLSSTDYTVFTYYIEGRDGDKPPLMLIPAATMWKPLPPNINQTPQLLPFHVPGARLS